MDHGLYDHPCVGVDWDGKREPSTSSGFAQVSVYDDTIMVGDEADEDEHSWGEYD